MSERSTLLLLQDISTAIQKIFSYLNGYTLATYEADNKTKDAVERNFEIIGEAAGRISEILKYKIHRSNSASLKILETLLFTITLESTTK